MERIIYKSKLKRLFDLNGGICYLKLRGSIYFLASTKYDSISMLRKAMISYEKKQPKEFYDIIHADYLFWCEKTKKINEKKQKTYKRMGVVKNKEKIKKLQAEIERLQNGDL